LSDSSSESFVSVELLFSSGNGRDVDVAFARKPAGNVFVFLSSVF